MEIDLVPFEDAFEELKTLAEKEGEILYEKK